MKRKNVEKGSPIPASGPLIRLTPRHFMSLKPRGRTHPKTPHLQLPPDAFRREPFGVSREVEIFQRGTAWTFVQLKSQCHDTVFFA